MGAKMKKKEYLKINRKGCTKKTEEERQAKDNNGVWKKIAYTWFLLSSTRTCSRLQFLRGGGQR